MYGHRQFVGEATPEGQMSENGNPCGTAKHMPSLASLSASLPSSAFAIWLAFTALGRELTAELTAERGWRKLRWL